MDKKPVRGMLTLPELQAKVEVGEIETIVTVFSDLYGRLFGKRITPEFFLEHTAKLGMNACNYLMTVDMEMDPVPGYKYASWELGYGDFHCMPDLETLRVASWLDKSALVICDVGDESTHELVSIAPRSILKKQIAAATEMGYMAQGASELEYFIFDETYASARSKHYADLKTFGAYIEDYHIMQGTREEALNAAARKHLAASGIPVEFSKGEWGPGQHELNVRYADLLAMADRHSLFKQALKEIAEPLGLSVTFMAKFDENHAGSSSHLHVSLWDVEGKRNIFAGAHGGKTLGPVVGSDEFRWFLGGWISHAKELMPFYAPTINS